MYKGHGYIKDYGPKWNGFIHKFPVVAILFVYRCFTSCYQMPVYVDQRYLYQSGERRTVEIPGSITINSNNLTCTKIMISKRSFCHDLY